MCSACMTISPAASKSAVEQSRRSLMLALWAERTRTAPISSHAARSAPAVTCRAIGVDGHRRPLQHERAGVVGRTAPALGDDERRLGQRDDGRTFDRLARRRAEVDRRGRQPAGDADGDELDLAVGVAVAIALLMQRLEALAQLVTLGAADRELVRLAVVAQVPGHLDLRLRAQGSPDLVAQRIDGGRVRVLVAEDGALRVGAAVRGGQAERAQHARGARDEDPRHPELLGDGGGVQRAGAAEGEQREARGSMPRSTVMTRSARTISALATRTMPSAHARASSPSSPAKRSTAACAAPASRSTSPASGTSALRWPSTRLASVTVGSVPPRP